MRKLVFLAALTLAGTPVYAQTARPVFPGANQAGTPVTATDGTTVYVPWLACTDAANNRISCGAQSNTSTPTQQGGTIAASGGTVQVFFVNTADTEIVNPSTATLWGSWGTPTVNGANSYPIAPGGSYRPPNRVAGTFTLLATAANQTYTVTRFQ